jgi:hypothetical protein
MFGPKHTFESVAKDLVDGLERGTIVLHPAEPTEADIKNFESMVKARLTSYRRIAIGLWVVTALLVTTAVLLPVILLPKDQSLAGFPYGGPVEFAILGFFAGMVTGHLFALRAHKRSVELMTFIQILKMADATTARRLVLWEGARLREKAFVP